MIFLNLGSFLAHLEPQLQVFTSPAKTDQYLYAYACAFKHLALTQYFVVIFITISLIGCPFPTCYLDTVASSDFYLDLFFAWDTLFCDGSLESRTNVNLVHPVLNLMQGNVI